MRSKDAAYYYTCSVVFVCRSVCVCCSQCERCLKARPIEMPFWVWTRVGPGNHVLGGDPDPRRGRDNFGSISRPFVYLL